VRPRARNIDDRVIAGIVSILDGWTGKLTWKLLIAAIAVQLGTRYTRQALNNHARIKQAFSHRKAKSSSDTEGPQKQHVLPELALAHQRIARLEAENDRLRHENNALLEQFVRWAYHASTRGLDKKFLNQPLPRVHREPTQEVHTTASKPGEAA
jgi:hypothetical protein